LLAHEEERSATVEALLEGRVTDSGTLWEAADVLRIARTGPYVVVAAELSHLGRPALPDVENALRVVDVHSAWRLTPDLQVGIVCIPKPEHFDKLVAVLERLTELRVGVSPQFDELAGTGVGLRLARIAVNGSLRGTTPITVFDDAPLAIAAVAAPDIMQRVAHHILGALDSLAAEEESVLSATFERWLDLGGSVNATAGAMFCHPNTVRSRLRRIEARTGRSLANPRELTELCLAFEVRRRKPPQL
jgi:sugar diacid utilization regulator